jgi:hypothetical protein
LNPKFFRNGIVMLALVVVALAVAITLVGQSTPAASKTYTEFLDDVSKGSVTTVTQEGSTLTVKIKSAPDYTVVVPGLLANQVLPDMKDAAAKGGFPLPNLGAKQAPDTS